MQSETQEHSNSDSRLAAAIREATALAVVVVFSFCSIYFYPQIKAAVVPVMAIWTGKVLATEKQAKLGAADAESNASEGAAEAGKEASEPNVVWGGEVHLQAGENGHFFADAYINDTAVRVILDTGATGVALTYEDALSIGLQIEDEQFTAIAKTANGDARVAPVILERVRIGEIEVEQVQAYVAEPGALFSTLLGMTFLSRLGGVEIRGSELVLLP
jgi:aspartyl protease family protein